MVTNFVLSVSAYSIRVAPAWSSRRNRPICVVRCTRDECAYTRQLYLNVYHLMLKKSIPIVVWRSPRCLSVPYRPVGCWREPFTDGVACLLWRGRRTARICILPTVEDA